VSAINPTILQFAYWSRTPETAPLFYSSERKDLMMYDCTRESIL
jgi:hypothetical protein